LSRMLRMVVKGFMSFCKAAFIKPKNEFNSFRKETLE